MILCAGGASADDESEGVGAVNQNRAAGEKWVAEGEQAVRGTPLKFAPLLFLKIIFVSSFVCRDW